MKLLPADSLRFCFSRVVLIWKYGITQALKLPHLPYTTSDWFLLQIAIFHCSTASSDNKDTEASQEACSQQYWYYCSAAHNKPTDVPLFLLTANSRQPEKGV